MSTIGQTTAKTCTQAVFQHLYNRHPEAFRWLQICSFLHPKNIPIRWTEKWVQSHKKCSRTEHKVLHIKILQIIHSYGLIRYQEKDATFSLHKKVSNIPHQNKFANCQRAWALIDRMRRGFDTKQPTPLQAKEIERWLPHVKRFMHDANKNHWLTRKIGSSICMTLGRINYGRENLEEALRCYQRALFVRKGSRSEQNSQAIADINSQINIVLGELESRNQ